MNRCFIFGCLLVVLLVVGLTAVAQSDPNLKAQSDPNLKAQSDPNLKAQSDPNLNVIDQLLPYHNLLKQRDIADLNLVVIHCTESPDLEAARLAGEEVRYASGTGNSGHYYIDRDGTIYRYVSDDRVAHHVVGFNDRSIGIELVNTGRAPHWFHSEHQQVDEPYPETQILALLALLRDLEKRYPNLRHIAGHHHLDLSMIATTDKPELEIRRKVDPGPLFPWDRVMEETQLRRISREGS